MSIGKPAKTFHRLEILAMCEDCPGRNKKHCIISDIEASKTDFIPLPPCMEKQITTENGTPKTSNQRKIVDSDGCSGSFHTYDKNGTPNDKNGTPNDENGTPNDENGTPHETKQRKINSGDGCSDSLIPMTKNGTHCSGKTGTPLYVYSPSCNIKLTELDNEILKLLSEKNHQRKIAKDLDRPLTTINRRITRMEKAGLIISYKGAYNTKIYKLSSKTPLNLHTPGESFIHNEDTETDALFTAHSMSFKFPILKGDQPKSSKGYRTKTWTGYVFQNPGFTARSTPKNILIDINEDLSAQSIDDLNLKYSQLAQSYAYKFAEKHHITLGGISKNRQAHFTIKNNALAQIISERGEFRTESGLMIDRSQSSGDLEMNEENALAMEYTITKLPSIAAGIQTNTKTIQTRLSDITTGIEDIKKWLVLERENRQLITQNKILEESLERIAKEVDEIKSHIPDPKDETKPGEMYG